MSNAERAAAKRERDREQKPVLENLVKAARATRRLREKGAGPIDIERAQKMLDAASEQYDALIIKRALGDD